ncbi:MAG: redox-sensing transcriptional repressor Rex [Synergistaceae bacterium]|nr:redox-sensing transcriptional repressor Rex [Synergistaceae bacterium]
MRIAEPTVERLVQYHRLLEQLRKDGRKVVSSQEMGEILSFKASQVRKDLSYFGEIGKRGVGYSVDSLHRHIDRILATPEKWSIGLVGVGKLGEALLGYQAFRKEKFHFSALFDNDKKKIGTKIQGIECYSSDDIEKVLREKNISVLMVSVPASGAPLVVAEALKAGTLKGILNFAPVSLTVPEGVLLIPVDISIELEKLFFYIKHKDD